MFKSISLSVPERQARDYSVGRAILCADNNLKTPCFEQDIHQEIQKQVGWPARGGIFIPWSLRPQMSGLDAKTGAAGGYSVGNVVELVTALRIQSRVIGAGAQLMPNLSATVTFAQESTVPTASWVAENPGSDIADSDAIFAAATARPKTLQSTTSLSRQLLTQNSVELENYLRFALSAAHATAIDASALVGSGTVNEPLGLLRIAALPTVSIGANGGTLTYDHLVTMEQTIGDAGSDDPNLVWITTPTQRGKLRKSYINTGSVPVWGEVGPLGYQGFVSRNCPSTLSKGSANGTLSAVLLGAWANMLIPMWGTFELITDPFTAKKTNMVQFSSFQMCDILVKRIGAFCAVLDAS